MPRYIIGGQTTTRTAFYKRLRNACKKTVWAPVLGGLASMKQTVFYPELYAEARKSLNNGAIWAHLDFSDECNINFSPQFQILK